MSLLDEIASEQMALEPRLLDVPAERYHADDLGTSLPSLSHSVAVTLLSRSALHAWHQHPRLGGQEREPSKEMEEGSAAHALLFGPADSVVPVAADNWRTKAAKEDREAIRAAHKLPVLASRFEDLQRMVGVARDAFSRCVDTHPYTLDDGDAEKSLVWVDDGGPYGSVYCRARFDWVSMDRRLIVDYKTTENADPTAFQRRIFGLGHDLQDAFYRRGLKVAFGVDAHLVFLVQETEAPYACSFVSLDPMAAQQAEIRRDEACRRWARYLSVGYWPGYPDRIAYVNEPGWISQQWAERLSLSPVSPEDVL